MNRWLRVVMPPWWIIALAVAWCTLTEAFALVLELWLGSPIFAATELDRTNRAFAGMVLVVYAFYRVGGFHPASMQGYFLWLRATPWTSAKPLPLGPIHLVLQDALFLALMVGVCWPRSSVKSVVVLQAFLFAYLIALAIMHAITGATLWSYAAGFGIAVMTWFVFDPLLFSLAAALTYGVAFLGLRSSLASFPWPDAAVIQQYEQAPRFISLGWPYDRLGPPRREGLKLTLRDTFVTGLLAGWWFYVVNDLVRGESDYDGGYVVFYLASGAAVAARLGCYCIGYAPPISLLGRIVHGRWIIPGYDRVFIAPLLAVFVGVAAALARKIPGIDPYIVPPVALTLTWWTILGVGPSLLEWRLTGNHRVVAGLVQARPRR